MQPVVPQNGVMQLLQPQTDLPGKVSDEVLADYIGHLAHDLARLAKDQNFGAIAYLLELVEIEANALAPNRSRSRPERGGNPASPEVPGGSSDTPAPQ